MSIRFDGLIERWPSEHVLYVVQLPGFQVNGADASDLQVKAGPALQSHLDWLVERELIEAAKGEVDLIVKEDRDAPGSSTGPLFEADLFHPTEDAIELALAIGRAAISEVIDVAESLRADGNLDRIAWTLEHLAQLDRWYASRLGPVCPPEAGDLVDRLIAEASQFETVIDEYTLISERDLISVDGEDWTLAKVLRRRTGHSREHMPDLIRALREG